MWQHGWITNNYVEWEKPYQKKAHASWFCYLKLYKIETNDSDTKQIIVAWGHEVGVEREERIIEEHMGTFEGDGYVYDLDCGYHFMGIYIRQSLLNLYTVNMCGLMHINYTSVKLFQKISCPVFLTVWSSKAWFIHVAMRSINCS